MTRLIKFRMTAFALAIVLVTLAIGWAAHVSWRRGEVLGDKLTHEQFETFQAALKFRANLETLNSVLSDYQSSHGTNDWQRFLKGRKQLDDWIDTQTNVTSRAERDLLAQINTQYDDYFAAAQKLEARSGVPSDPGATRSALEAVKRESDRLLRLDNQLLAAHRTSLNTFLEDSHKALTWLRGLMFTSLLALLVLGAWLAVMVYREMIAPLQRQLVESHALLERQEKLASLGVLAAGVAHEIRNPLTSIKARLFTQQKTLRAGSPEHEDAVVIGKEINRLESIVKDVLQFARPAEPEFVVMPAATPLREVHDLLMPQFEKRGFKLVLDSTVDAQIRIDSRQLKQVLINLVQNAADSLDPDGTVTLRALVRDERLGGHLMPAVVLEVEDSGKGIPPEVRERIFDPFFTTKETGTGLGLTIAARIVEKHGGALTFQTQVHHGTIFGIVLPQVT